MTLALVDTPHACELHIDHITVTGRHRTDLGDLRALADSIDTVGLIHPVVVTPDNELIAGARRIAAMKLLGWETIPVTVIQTLADATDRLLAERDENTCRKGFTASEIVAIGRRLEELERPKAEVRQRGGLRQGDHPPSGSTEPNGKGSVDQVVGEALGVSQSTYKRYKTVVAATTDPEESVRDVAIAELAKLDAGQTTPYTAGQRVRTARLAIVSSEPPAESVAEPPVVEIPHVEQPADEPVAELPAVEPDVELLGKPKGGHRPNHLKILTNIVNNLDGFAMVLADIEEINNTINADEARRLKSDLDRHIRSLNRIRNLLKGI